VSANRLLLEARAAGGRTLVSRIRADGLLRASRPFREGTASRVVVAHLGPGMIRGDAFAIGGEVAPGAHLVVAGQMATRVLSGPEPATHDARWHVHAGARLELRPEPVLVSGGAAYVGTTTLVLEDGASATVSEIVLRERGAAVRTTIVVRRATRLALVDALAIDAEAPAAPAVGTLLFLADVDVGALDACADAMPDVRVGIGTFREGDVLLRVTGAGVREIDAALRVLRAMAQKG